MLRLVALWVSAGGVAVFFIVHIALFFSPPGLVIDAPGDGSVVTVSEIMTSGTVEARSRLTVNGAVIYVDPETASFQERLSLLPGENAFVFRAEDRVGRTREVVRRVYRIK